MKFGDRFRLWTTLNETPLALGLVVLIVAIGAGILIGGALWALQPQGSTEEVEGVVQSFGMRESDQGSYRVVVVRTADGPITTRAPVRRRCQVGDRAVMDRKPIRAGAVYSLKSCRSA